MNRLKQQLNRKNLLFVTAIVVVLIAVFAILLSISIKPAVALEQELRCGSTEHTHTDDCYDGDFLICEKTAHAHDGNCYIVLLGDNNINDILTLVENNREHSLEHVITDVVSDALTFNNNINRVYAVGAGALIGNTSTTEQQQVAFTPTEVAKLNETISDNESTPTLVLNENLNQTSTINIEETPSIEGDIDVDGTVQIAGSIGDATSNTVALDNSQTSQGDVSTLAVGDTASSSNYDANIYIYLDGEWTCIGTLDFTTTRNGGSSWYPKYDSTLSTSTLLDFVNGILGTEYSYNSFDISVSSSLNGTYSKNNIGIGSVTTTLSYQQYSSTAQSAKYVRLIPNNGNANSTAFDFYTVTYNYPEGTSTKQYVRDGSAVTIPDGNYLWTDQDGNTYSAGDAVDISKTTTLTATLLGPPTFVNIYYDVSFPTVSSVTVATKPTLAGLSTTTINDEYTENSSVVVRNVSQQTVQGSVDGNTTGLSRVIQFKGWRVGNTDTIIQPNTTLVWEELVQYATGTNIRLTGVWDYSPLQTATFFIRFDSVAVDTDGNITGQDQNKYTNELFAAYVGGIDTSLSSGQLHNQYHIADTTSDNSFGADQEIRALYGERTDGVWLSAFPEDDYIFQSLVQYANTGYLSVDGVAVKAEDLNSREYAIRWYVFKCQDDAWHIDGKLVKKQGLIHVYKTFAGNKELIAKAKEGFYIDAYDETINKHTQLTLDNYKSYEDTTQTYMWEITNVDYGELWTITEHPNQLNDEGVEFSIFSEYTIVDAHGDQSITGTGSSMTVSGMTYALDEGVDEVLRASFTNIYNKANSIVIKKQDSLTGNSIGGATFQLLQNGEVLKFNYNETTASYEYAPSDGVETILSGTANGYFEIAIENFSYDLGPIVVREVSPPEGYTPIGDIEIGYLDDEKTIGIISGNSDLIKYMNGILIIGNSTDAVSVTAQKNWDCPETEWQDVTIQLLANGKLATTVIAGVEPEVVLNAGNNWSYTWTNLPVYVNGEKIEWTIKETKIGTEACKSDGSFVNWLASYSLPVYSTDSDGNEHVLLTVTNTTKRVMLRLTKMDLNQTVQLEGATFLLEAVDASGNVIASEVSKTATTGAAGTLIFDNMKTGVRYRLTETVAPTGYLPMDEYIYFTINEDGSVTVEESYYANAGSTAYNIIVRNAPSVLLPETGGGGNHLLFALGILLMTVAGGVLIGTIRKRRCTT